MVATRRRPCEYERGHDGKRYDAVLVRALKMLFARAQVASYRSEMSATRSKTELTY
jgi:hypothetical protein